MSWHCFLVECNVMTLYFLVIRQYLILLYLYSISLYKLNVLKEILDIEHDTWIKYLLWWFQGSSFGTVGPPANSWPPTYIWFAIINMSSWHWSVAHLLANNVTPTNAASFLKHKSVIYIYIRLSKSITIWMV